MPAILKECENRSLYGAHSAGGEDSEPDRKFAGNEDAESRAVERAEDDDSRETLAATSAGYATPRRTRTTGNLEESAAATIVSAADVGENIEHRAHFVCADAKRRAEADARRSATEQQ